METGDTVSTGEQLLSALLHRLQGDIWLNPEDTQIRIQVIKN